MFNGFFITHHGQRIPLSEEEAMFLKKGISVETILTQRKQRSFKSGLDNLTLRVELRKFQEGGMICSQK